MKIQDVGFLVALVFLWRQRKPQWAVLAGLLSLLLAMPLFKFWIFFTAERLVGYAAAFFALAIIQNRYLKHD